ncbi:hypothetical protein FA95DRAFT_1504967, partial [Auriscalpium vulgare]
ILDHEERIVAVLVGRPVESDQRKQEDRWEAAAERAADLFEAVRASDPEAFPPPVEHRRGVYSCVNVGISHGGGSKAPHNTSLGSPSRAALVQLLLDNLDVQRLAGFASGALAAYYPKAYQDMCEALASLYERQPELLSNFRNSAYPMATFNLGPETVTFEHNDCKNYPSLPCAITALGRFNPDKGGQLYLRDLRLKIRFPSGSTILLPSAGLRHGNSAIQAGERRYSMTQYCLGELMRWVRHGFRPAGSLSKAERGRVDSGRWAAQLGRLSKLSELAGDRLKLKEWEMRMSKA